MNRAARKELIEARGALDASRAALKAAVRRTALLELQILEISKLDSGRRLAIEPPRHPLPTVMTGLPQVQVESEQVLGEIMVAEPDQGFVAVNRGSQHGLSEGMVLQVFRGGASAGSIRLDSVDQRISSGVVLTQNGEGLRKGDMVRSDIVHRSQFNNDQGWRISQ